jgi:excinuclease UvrABC nuclease subunit
MDKVKWKSYEFEVYDPDNTKWNDVAGIYIFTGLNARGLWVPFYIGQAKSFADRIPNHANWSAAARLGATHVHAMVVPLAANRDKIEAELIEAYQPALNVQLK